MSRSLRKKTVSIHNSDFCRQRSKEHSINNDKNTWTEQKVAYIYLLPTGQHFKYADDFNFPFLYQLFLCFLLRLLLLQPSEKKETSQNKIWAQL